VVLTSHASPALAIPNGVALPAGVTYLAKFELGSLSDLVAGGGVQANNCQKLSL